MAAWTKSEVRRIIVEALTPIVAPAGFRFKKSSDAFVRAVDGGRQDLGLALFDYNPRFEFSLNLCTRIEAVQAITNPFIAAAPRYYAITLTSITQLEFLGVPAGSSQRVRWAAESESELAALLPAVARMVEERVLPFFDEYRDVAAINRGLNPAGAERISDRSANRSEFDATDLPYRAMTGVAIAHVARDPRLPELVAAYRAQIRGIRDEDRRKFDDLVASLKIV